MTTKTQFQRDNLQKFILVLTTSRYKYTYTVCLIDYVGNCFLWKHLTSDSAGVSFHPWNIQLPLGEQNKGHHMGKFSVYIQNIQIGRISQNSLVHLAF